MPDYHIKIEGSKFDHGSSVIHNEYGSQKDGVDDAILQELKKIQTFLENTEPMIANAVGELQKALKEQNKPKISGLITQLSTGFAANLLSNLASGSLLRFLGIG